MITYDDEWIKAQIKEDEGFSHVAYLDTEGKPTVGWGHMDESLVVGEFYKLGMLKKWFDDDYDEAVIGYESLGLNLTGIRRAILIMMVYNLGVAGVKKFRRMLGYLVSKEYELAGVEMLKSKWRRQVKGRSHRLSAAMITDEWV